MERNTTRAVPLQTKSATTSGGKQEKQKMQNFQGFTKRRSSPLDQWTSKQTVACRDSANGEPRGAGDLLRGSDLAPSM